MLGALVASDVLGEDEASSMMEAGVIATADAGKMFALEEQEMREDAETAMVQHLETSREQARQLEEALAARAVQAEEAQQRLAQQQQQLLSSEVCSLTSL